MSNTHNHHFSRRDPENYPEVSDSQTEVSIPFAGQCLDVTVTRLSVASQRKKNSQRVLAVYGA